MANHKGKIIIKLLLVITMVIQPVSFSYAMASMSQGDHAQYSASNHAGDHIANDAMAEVPDHNDHKAGSGTDNCCLTLACSPASVMDAFDILQVSSSGYIEATASLLISIDVPAEIKPPRDLLG